jgi:hypothetical protein
MRTEGRAVREVHKPEHGWQNISRGSSGVSGRWRKQQSGPRSEESLAPPSSDVHELEASHVQGRFSCEILRCGRGQLRGSDGEVIRRLRTLVKTESDACLPLDVDRVVREVVGILRNDALIHKVQAAPPGTRSTGRIRTTGKPGCRSSGNPARSSRRTGHLSCSKLPGRAPASLRCPAFAPSDDDAESPASVSTAPPGRCLDLSIFSECGALAQEQTRGAMSDRRRHGLGAVGPASRSYPINVDSQGLI